MTLLSVCAGLRVTGASDRAREAGGDLAFLAKKYEKTCCKVKHKFPSVALPKGVIGPVLPVLMHYMERRLRKRGNLQ